jgi:quercetin dioxygenase-like cupin family protein
MKAGVSIAATVLVGATIRGQEGPAAPADISGEPHHTVVFENSAVRVFHVKLQPGEATKPHHHKNLYAYLSLYPVSIAAEVRGRPPVVVSLEAGELHTSKGGFTLAERNKSPTPADLLVIEALKSDGAGFATPVGFHVHDAAYGELFKSPVMRGYTMNIAAGGRIEKRDEKYDRLVVAISDLKLREEMAGQASSELQMKAGEIKWLDRGVSHATTNTGTAPAALITFEFE